MRQMRIFVAKMSIGLFLILKLSLSAIKRNSEKENFWKNIFEKVGF